MSPSIRLSFRCKFSPLLSFASKRPSTIKTKIMSTNNRASTPVEGQMQESEAVGPAGGEKEMAPMEAAREEVETATVEAAPGEEESAANDTERGEKEIGPKSTAGRVTYTGGPCVRCRPHEDLPCFPRQKAGKIKVPKCWRCTELKVRCEGEFCFLSKQIFSSIEADFI